MPSPRAERRRAALKSGTASPSARKARLADIQNTARANARAVTKAITDMAAPQPQPTKTEE